MATQSVSAPRYWTITPVDGSPDGLLYPYTVAIEGSTVAITNGYRDMPIVLSRRSAARWLSGVRHLGTPRRYYPWACWKCGATTGTNIDGSLRYVCGTCLYTA